MVNYSAIEKGGVVWSKFSYNGGTPNDARPQGITSIDKPSSPTGSSSNARIMAPLNLPPTSCQVGKQSCGYGVACQAEPRSLEGIAKVLWGVVLEVSSCAWSSASSLQNLEI